MKDLSLYIHVPFCLSKCSYCSFVSFTDLSLRKKYLQAFKKEISLYRKNYSAHKIRTIFIGGGTPSCLNEGEVGGILQAVRQNFAVDKNAEITIECNPNSVTKQKLEEYKKAGINRISIGAQSTNNKTLKLIGRTHTFKQLNTALNLAKEVGIENINVDILLGLPKQKLSHIKHTLRYLIKKDVPHISAYSLILEEGTKIFEDIKNKKLLLPPEDKVVKMYTYVQKFLEKRDILRYEVSNFSKPGFECKHNLAYWTMKEYLGLGVAAHSFVNLIRWSNTENLQEYLRDLSKDKLPVINIEKLDNTNLQNENIMLALRTREGLNIKDFNKSYNCNFLKDKQKEIEFLISKNFIIINDSRLVVNPNSFYILNSIIQKLIY